VPEAMRSTLRARGVTRLSDEELLFWRNLYLFPSFSITAYAHILNFQRYRPHPTHAHLERTLGWIERLKPGRAILTNLHIDLDFETLRAELPRGVEPGYDGLVFEHELGNQFI